MSGSTDRNANSEGWSPRIPVIIASHRLPVRLRNGKVEWAGDRVIEAQNAFSHYEISDRASVKFVGRLPYDHGESLTPEQRVDVEKQLNQLNCYSVDVDPHEAKLFYEDYCKQTLWPTFHNIVDVYSPIDVVMTAESNANSSQDGSTATSPKWNPNLQKTAWHAYTNVNQIFANKICELYEPGDVVWVQDYHLLLTPTYIIRRIRGANVGLYLHVPFPSSEVFRTLSSRKELLRGMLNADHVGFHFFEYARHFMSACKRILGVQTHPILRGQLGVDYGGRRVAITCSHMAVDIERIGSIMMQETVRDQVVALRQKYQGRMIVAGVDTIERLSGIPAKILGFDIFLACCPEFIGRIVLVQKGVHRRGRMTDYRQSKKEIDALIQYINDKYRDQANGDVVEYEELQEFSFKERLALWRVADIQISTVIRDGLNTSPFEYIATHKTAPGVIILSEFSGSSLLLSGALTVNPWEPEQVADALRNAVYMSPEDRAHRRDGDLHFVASNPPRRWAKCVLSDILDAKKKDEDYVYMGTGFGLDFRVVEVSASFRKLTSEELVPAYQTSTKRAFFFDYYRTLAPDVSHVVRVRWPDVPRNTLATLEHLCKDPRNSVYIVSGCECELLTEKFGGVPGLGLIAEHGYFIRRPLLGDEARIGGRPWEQIVDSIQSQTAGASERWRRKAKEVMQLYVDRTNGAVLEMRRSAILFRYGKSDDEFGQLQAAELKQHLEETFAGWPLNVVQGKDYVELRPDRIGKGKVIGNILQSDANTEFVLCIGDDIADELMFEKLDELVEKGELSPGKVFSCTVGQKPSKADYFVDDHTDVAALLKSLTVVSTKSNRNYSLSDMQAFVKDTRPLLGSSLHATNIRGSAPSLSKMTMRRTSSRRRVRGDLMTVLEEDQSFHNLDGGESRTSSPSKRTKQRYPWVGWLQSIGELFLAIALIRWRSKLQHPRDKKLLSYFMAWLASLWLLRRLRRPRDDTNARKK